MTKAADWIARAESKLTRLEDPERNTQNDTNLLLEALVCVGLSIAETLDPGPRV